MTRSKRLIGTRGADIFRSGWPASVLGRRRRDAWGARYLKAGKAEKPRARTGGKRCSSVTHRPTSALYTPNTDTVSAKCGQTVKQPFPLFSVLGCSNGLCNSGGKRNRDRNNEEGKLANRNR